MTCFAIVLLGLTSLVSARSAYLSVPLTYATPLTLGTQIATDVSNNPEVARRDRVNLVNQDAARSAEPQVQQEPSRGQRPASENAPASPAPLGADGRVVDTPEVAAARAAHAAAHVNEKIKLADEAARSGDGRQDSSKKTNGNANGEARAPEATLGPDGRVQDTPEVAAARAAHVAAHVNEKIKLAKEAARTNDALARVASGPVVPLVLGNGVVAALVPVDGRPNAAPVSDDRNPANDALPAKTSVDALAVAGPGLAYGRLVY